MTFRYIIILITSLIFIFSLHLQEYNKKTGYIANTANLVNYVFSLKMLPFNNTVHKVAKTETQSGTYLLFTILNANFIHVKYPASDMRGDNKKFKHQHLHRPYIA